MGPVACGPENTLPSFEAALDAGANSLETDVHLTADGVPVLIHDPSLPDGRADSVDDGGGTRGGGDPDARRALSVWSRSCAKRGVNREVIVDVEIKCVPFLRRTARRESSSEPCSTWFERRMPSSLHGFAVSITALFGDCDRWNRD